MWSAVSIELRIAAVLWLVAMIVGTFALGYLMGRLAGLRQSGEDLAKIKRSKNREEAKDHGK